MRNLFPLILSKRALASWLFFYEEILFHEQMAIEYKYDTCQDYKALGRPCVNEEAHPIENLFCPGL